MALGIWSRLQSLVFGGAIGAAFSRGMEAVLEPVRQKAWEQNQVRILGPGTLAELAAKGFSKLSDLDNEAARNGYNANRLQALYALAQSYPGLADLDKLSNRELIDPEQVRRVLARHGFGEEWITPLVDLFSDLLSPIEVANAIQQGHLPNDDVLPSPAADAPEPEGYITPTAPDGAPPSTVPLTQIDLDPVKEAAGGGIDLPRLKVLANLSGLPPPQGELRDMLNRGIIDRPTFVAGVREGHTKTKWIQAVERLRWAVIPAREYAEAWLRNWVSEDEAKAGGALTGYTAAQMELLYKNRGRTATPRQIWLAVARGIVAPDYPDEPANGRITSLHDHELAIARSNIRPEYAPLLWAIRFNYPSLFQLGRLVQSGATPPDTAAKWASYNLEAPDVIAELHIYWLSIYPGPPGSSSSTSVPSEVKSQRTKLLTTIHNSYVGGAADVEQVQLALGPLDYPQTTIDGIIEVWDQEKAFNASVAGNPPGPTT